MKSNYISPQLELKAFNCAHCQVYADQDWYFFIVQKNIDGWGEYRENQQFRVSYCRHCGAPSIWDNSKLIYPLFSTILSANEDLPDDIKIDYNEAKDIVNNSPRGAAALLRLSIQKLCKFLGESGNDLNNDIKNLVAKGLPNKVQEALDSVRVIGNESVHPGELDLRDDRETALKLFKLVNFITDKMIAEPKEIGEIYSSLPEKKLDAIKDRDKK